MKNDDNKLCIRYLFADHNRKHVIQRGNGDFWTGDGWSPILDCARLFREHRAAQVAWRAIQMTRYGGKPSRTFRVEVGITLMGDDVADVTKDMLVKFLYDAVRIDVETSVFGCGPLEDVYCEARMKLATVEEHEPEREAQ